MLVTVGIFYMRSPGEPSQYIYMDKYVPVPWMVWVLYFIVPKTP